MCRITRLRTAFALRTAVSRCLGNLPDPVFSRRAEDKAVLADLGATVHHFDTPDSIYRRIGDEIAYPDLAALFSEPRGQELESLPESWQGEIGNLGFEPAETVVYAPLAAGNHVDHQLARVLALRLVQDGWQVWFFEDYPHVGSGGALAVAQAWFGPVSWHARTVAIRVNAKIAAIRGYQTQLPFMFGDERAMAEQVRRFTAATACSISLHERIRRLLAGSGGRRERLWRAIWGYHAHAERLWLPCDGSLRGNKKVDE